MPSAPGTYADGFISRTWLLPEAYTHVTGTWSTPAWRPNSRLPKIKKQSSAAEAVAQLLTSAHEDAPRCADRVRTGTPPFTQWALLSGSTRPGSNIVTGGMRTDPEQVLDCNNAARHPQKRASHKRRVQTPPQSGPRARGGKDCGGCMSAQNRIRPGHAPQHQESTSPYPQRRNRQEPHALAPGFWHHQVDMLPMTDLDQFSSWRTVISLTQNSGTISRTQIGR